MISSGLAFSANSSPAPGLVGEMVLADQPRFAQPCPRTMSDELSVEVRPANRHANRSRSDVGMMSELGRWVAATTIRPTARPRATRKGRSTEDTFWAGVLLFVG